MPSWRTDIWETKKHLSWPDQGSSIAGNTYYPRTPPSGLSSVYSKGSGGCKTSVRKYITPGSLGSQVDGCRFELQTNDSEPHLNLNNSVSVDQLRLWRLQVKGADCTAESGVFDVAQDS